MEVNKIKINSVGGERWDEKEGARLSGKELPEYLSWLWIGWSVLGWAAEHQRDQTKRRDWNLGEVQANPR
jgi:hypothetical protein